MLDQIKQFSQQFSFMRTLLGMLGGTAKPKAIQDWILGMMNDDDGGNKKYKDLEGQDKESVDAIVKAFTELTGFFDEAIDAKAAMCFKFYKALMKAGFDEASALRIVASQGVDVMKPKE